MPINKAYHLEELMDTIIEYIAKTNRRVTFEYIMLENINDSEKEAKELVKLLKGINFIQSAVTNILIILVIVAPPKYAAILIPTDTAVFLATVDNIIANNKNINISIALTKLYNTLCST